MSVSLFCWQLSMDLDPVLIDHMLQRGWFPQYADMELTDVLATIDTQTFAHELARYQDWLGKQPTVDGLQEGFCGLEDRPALRGSTCGWPELRITWHTEGGLPGIPPPDFQQQARDTWPRIDKHCGATLEYTPNNKTANLLLHAPSTRPPGFGQAGGVLADAQLVPCGLTANKEFQSEARYDSERWKLGFGLTGDGKIPLGSVLGHEGMHQLGIPHGPNGNWMAPTLSAINTCQPWEVTELQKRYGPPKPVDVPPPPGTPTAGKTRFSFESGGLVANAEWGVDGKLLAGHMTGARITILGG